ncbi:MAG TPA: hypothetical protein DD670_10860 [Planctomycetaceae bacterium]|nr:hypothetical protein [Planctomycetaceae bacterium]
MKARAKSKETASSAVRRSPSGGDWGSLARQLGVDVSEAPPVEAAGVPKRAAEVPKRAAEVPKAEPANVGSTTTAAVASLAETAFVEESPSRSEAVPTAENRLPRKRKRRGHRSRERKPVVEDSTQPTTDAVQTPADEADEADEAEACPGDADTVRVDGVATDSRERTERPGRGRRGRGRRKKSSDRYSADDSAQNDAKEKSATAESSKGREGERQTSKGDGQESDELELDADIAVAHRGIPSWREAVGMVIETNLSKRSKKGSGDSSNRPREHRGRGGRGKNGATPRRSS